MSGKALVVALLSTVGLTAVSAKADVMTWIMTNHSPYEAQVSFYSQNRGHEWPGHGNSWDLFDHRPHRFTLECGAGEKICYGAFVLHTHSRVWGVGYNNTKHCDDCCATCGETSTMERSLGE